MTLAIRFKRPYLALGVGITVVFLFLSLRHSSVTTPHRLPTPPSHHAPDRLIWKGPSDAASDTKKPERPPLRTGGLLGGPDASGWLFAPALDANTHSLSCDQCTAAFPALYQRIDDSVRARRHEAIAFNDVVMADGRCMMRIMIHDRELFVLESGEPEECYVSNNRERMLGTLHLLDRAVAASSEPVPDIEAVLSVDDSPRRSIDRGVMLGFTRPVGDNWADVWLLPHYSYWAWNGTDAPSYQALRRDMAAVEDGLAWVDKLDKAIWRGKTDANPIRGQLISKAKGQPWSDIKGSNVVQMPGDREKSTNDMPLTSHCQYKYTVEAEGYTYSGKLKYLQQCRSVLVAHPLNWEEFHSHMLRSSGPQQNYILTTKAWGDLDQQIGQLMQNPAEAERIANNSYAVFPERNLSPAAISCYLRRLIRSYASLQSFEVMPYEEDQSGNIKLRGTPFSAFATDWPADPSRIS